MLKDTRSTNEMKNVICLRNWKTCLLAHLGCACGTICHLTFYFLWLNKFSYNENKFRKWIRLQHSFGWRNQQYFSSLKCSPYCISLCFLHYLIFRGYIFVLLLCGIWGYRCILGALLSHVGNLVEQHPTVRILVLSAMLVLSKIPYKKYFVGVLEMRKSNCISELPSRKKSPGIFFFYPAGESLPQSSSHLFSQSMKILCNSNWNSRYPQGLHHLWMCPLFTWSYCGVPHCKVLRSCRFWGA